MFPDAISVSNKFKMSNDDKEFVVIGKPPRIESSMTEDEILNCWKQWHVGMASSSDLHDQPDDEAEWRQFEIDLARHCIHDAAARCRILAAFPQLPARPCTPAAQMIIDVFCDDADKLSEIVAGDQDACVYLLTHLQVLERPSVQVPANASREQTARALAEYVTIVNEEGRRTLPVQALQVRARELVKDVRGIAKGEFSESQLATVIVRADVLLTSWLERPLMSWLKVPAHWKYFILRDLPHPDRPLATLADMLWANGWEETASVLKTSVHSVVRRIMEAPAGITSGLSTSERLQILQETGVGLWTTSAMLEADLYDLVAVNGNVELRRRLCTQLRGMFPQNREVDAVALGRFLRHFRSSYAPRFQVQGVLAGAGRQELKVNLDGGSALRVVHHASMDVLVAEITPRTDVKTRFRLQHGAAQWSDHLAAGQPSRLERASEKFSGLDRFPIDFLLRVKRE